MPFTTPATVATGSVASSTAYNSQVINNIAWLGSDAPACQVYRNSNLSLTNNTDTVVAYNLESFDTANMHDAVTNTSRITIPTGGGGLYQILTTGIFAANATGVRRLDILLNGGTLIGRSGQTGSSSINAFMQTEAIYRLNAGDYVETQVYQNSGGALNFEYAASYASFFTVLWIRN